MIYDWILVGDDFGFLSQTVAEWLAYGLGLGAIFWMVGSGVALIFRFLRY